jgi:hypothetical protein
VANILLMIASGLLIFGIVNVIGGLFYLIIMWFTANRHWPWPLSVYFDWVNRKTHDIKAKAEAKRLSDEWREMNERSNQ